MKNTFILICAIFCSLQMVATNLVLLKSDGTQQLQDIAAIGKWVFIADDLQLLDKSGNVLATEALNDIKKITFVGRTAMVILKKKPALLNFTT